MTARFRPAPAVAVEATGDELVLLNLDTGRFWLAQGLGPAIWHLLCEGHTTDEVIAEVSKRYGVPRSKASADLEAYAANLVREGLLVAVASNGRAT